MFRKTVEHGVSYMGPFGAMGPKSKGIITYSWSPYVQKPFYGLFSKSITNMAHRVASSLPFIAPAIILNLGIFYWAETTYAKNQLKDPRDFE
ncbi:UcrQ family protein [Fonticula alba]|uniref:Cytochrome b-c1 complex subunit 8 n=1 Tax=Fonticula alba TaxID=691883 RepID=A0A058Z7T7_FONAL|nr:UcrQ family protein [Fonticula alba]KCV70181.1 UcrQ family protein [Fonticula alba]|eukprot:XP_009495787.1 UcrQ family protein [Fonticula alba]